MSDLAPGITRRLGWAGLGWAGLVCSEGVNAGQVERYTPVLGGSWKIEKAAVLESKGSGRSGGRWSGEMLGLPCLECLALKGLRST